MPDKSEDDFETIELAGQPAKPSFRQSGERTDNTAPAAQDDFELEGLLTWQEEQKASQRRQKVRAVLHRLTPYWLQSRLAYMKLNTEDESDQEEQLRLVDSDDEDSEGKTLHKVSRRRPLGHWVPEDSAGWFSKLLFLWVDSLMTMGVKKPLEQADLWDVSTRDCAETVAAHFQETLELKSQRIASTAWAVHGRRFILVGLLKLVHDIVMLSIPFILQQLLLALERDASTGVTLGLACAMGAASLFETLSVNVYFHILFRMGLHLKVSLVSVLYQKTLRLSNAVKGKMGVGAIVNLQSNDAAKLWGLPQYMHVLWSGPFQILVVMAMLTRVIHFLPALAGLVMTALLVPLSAWVGRVLSTVRKQLVVKTDARVKLCGEVATGIKAIKLYAWEQPYTERITELRADELQSIRKAATINIASNMAWQGGPLLISLVSLGTYTLMGYPLTAAVAFPALALFNQLRFPVAVFPEQISKLIQAHVALKRIQEFIGADEMVQPALTAAARPGKLAVQLQGASFRWQTDAADLLHDVTLQVPAGQLVIVVGDVGSGKSSLLQAIMGEMHISDGTSQIAGSTSYTAQDPWIQTATLRNNVLMGAPFESQQYWDVLEACALAPDLEILPAGDMSEIGEKGINLSGGQRHRVALARACYADADVYLLDDPLSAVDAHVGKHLFDKCICGHLGGKTRILATHQLQYLPGADLIAVLRDGRIQHTGTYDQLLDQGVDFQQFAHAREPNVAAETGSIKEVPSSSTISAVNTPNMTPVASQTDMQQNGRMDGQMDSHLDGVIDGQTGVQAGGVASAVQLIAEAAEGQVLSSIAAAQVFQTDSAAGITADSVAQDAADSNTVNGATVVGKQPVAGNRGVADTVQGQLPAAGLVTEAHQQPNAQLDIQSDDDFDEMTPFMSAVPLSDTAEGKQFTGGLTDFGLVNGKSSSLKSKLSKGISFKKGTKAGAPEGAPKRGPEGALEGGLGSKLSKKLSMANSMKLGGRYKLVKTEERAVGSVDRKLYASYLRSWGPYFVLPIMVITACGMERLCRVMQDWWLAHWSAATSKAAATGVPLQRWPYLAAYIGFAVVALGLQFCRQFTLVTGTTAASRKMHAMLLSKMMRLPMSFFDSQPSGRLLNRFTRDMESVDINVPGTFNSALNCVVNVFGSLIVVCAVSPGMLVLLAALAFVYSWLQQRYIAVSREAKRLDSIAFSPIFSTFGESAAGLVTIRALRKQQTFQHHFYAVTDNSSRAWWPCQCVNRWLSVRLELIGLTVVFGSAIFVSVLQQRSAGLAGLAITSALNLTGLMNWMVRQVSQLEVDMNSVERLLEYETYDTEKPAIIPSKRPSPQWPTAGAISAQQLVVRYRPELDPVLKGISFSIAAREKVGIAGRTGCGKSTLLMALYRIIEPSSGTIIIDDVDICTIGLQDLRSRLALVPQDPVIFSGTVRSNIDPWSDAPSDAALWEALRQAGMENVVKQLQGGLDAPLNEGGCNLSTGQRQLLCMARALLRNARILVLDEATSNVDSGTDAVIQATIRSAFAQCTVLTVAHRLHTIMDSDKILCLTEGKVAEFDSPTNLLANPNGLFSGMVSQTLRHRTKSGAHRSKSALALAAAVQQQ